jgi:methionyl-tRNA formyltransferase
MRGPRVVLAGSVASSLWTVEELLAHGGQLVGVLGLSPSKARSVSGYVHLAEIANTADIPYLDFERINDADVISQVVAWQPDLLFVIGLSQLVGKELLAVPTRGTVGFHPTQLPRGRGRAPVAWLVVTGEDGAATFFVMDEGVDAGPILAQERFDVGPDDYASDVMAKLETATRRALALWIPTLARGEWNPRPQDHSKATWTGIRRPADGLIDWTSSAKDIYALVRAASRPHPGAYTHAGTGRLRIWRARLELARPIRGAVGRVLDVGADGALLVQTGDGLIWLTEVEWDGESGGPVADVRVGARLGYIAENEIFQLKQKLAELELRLRAIEKRGD